MARMTIGSAVQTQQAIQVALVLASCYLVANPEYTPSFFRPYVSQVRSGISVCFSAVFGGWWPLVAGTYVMPLMSRHSQSTNQAALRAQRACVDMRLLLPGAISHSTLHAVPVGIPMHHAS